MKNALANLLTWISNRCISLVYLLDRKSGESKRAWRDVVVLASDNNNGVILSFPEGKNLESLNKISHSMTSVNFEDKHWGEFNGIITLDNTLDGVIKTNEPGERKIEPGL